MKYKDLTFIIPLRCESADRLRNLNLCLHWIKQKYNSPVIVKESNILPLGQNICNKFNNVIYLFEETNDKIFHRTKLLNDMIELCETQYILNFDCDVILPTENIDESLIKLNNNFSFVYPYGYGHSQKRIHNSDWENFKINLNLNELNVDTWTSQYGHCFIADLKIYKKAFGENEEFLSYGPEDQERFFRFKKLGYNVCHLNNDYYVYHLEHGRTPNSWITNPCFDANTQLYKKLQTMSIEDTILYYNNLEYVKQRNWNSCTV
jgi:predicted glycosyltransferase involved in capsule biosynthesis